jgi:LysM repeat protein
MISIKKTYISLCFIFIINYTFAQTLIVKQYIDSFKNIAMREMIEYKVPASITLAQGLLESGSGNSRLAKNGNNHFGIKCKKDWTGCTILEDDDALQECFRCYSTAEESFRDHSRFLKENKRYSTLFTYSITDYKSWAGGLLAAGYATNQKYTDLLIACIERNKLAKFDTLIVNGYNPYNQEMPANFEIINAKRIPVTVVQPNQNLETIATQNNKTEKKLTKYNDLNYHRIEPGDVLYLKPKKNKATIASHTVAEGEDMWTISQKYAIKLNALYKKNLMIPGTEPVSGTVLQLQHKASTTPDTSRKTIQPSSMPTNSNLPLNGDNWHIVSAGETLFSISKRYGLTVDELKAINKLEGNQLYLGQKLRIKTEGKTTEEPIGIKHIVKTGDTLYSISKLYGVTIEAIKNLNNLKSDSLTIGQIIIVK